MPRIFQEALVKTSLHLRVEEELSLVRVQEKGKLDGLDDITIVGRLYWQRPQKYECLVSIINVFHREMVGAVSQRMVLRCYCS